MNTTNYKVQHLKVFGSSENLYKNVKKYRQVYDEQECRYLYAELALYNKKFDEQDWESEIKFICTNADNAQHVCELKKTYEVKKDTNVYYVREGWGTPNPGWWKKGRYRWDAYVDGVLVGSVHFYVTNAGLVTPTANPYVKLKKVRLFESDINGLVIEKRKYLKAFNKATARYINIEISLDILLQEDSLPLEFQLNFYNDAGQHKAYLEYFIHITDKRKTLTFDVGYGSDSGNYWFDDKYSIEIVFMDQLIGVVPFTVGDTDEDLVGEMPFTTAGRLIEASINPNITVENLEKELTFEEATAELNSLTGLGSVKQQLQELATYLQFIKLRKEKGFKEETQINLNAAFVGNPGTGKTTVAKMLGKIYKSLGLLSKGHVYEVGRVDLVGEYIGQTAPKVQKAIEKARGGILFIDEAYALSDRGDDSKDFGKEVIEVLIKEMSDGKGDIAFIFAGYPKEMQGFLSRNPGMNSRIQSTITFPDYVPDELMQIVNFAAQKRDISFTEEAREFLHKKIVESYRNRNAHFGNARFINGVVEECKQNMALRLMRLGSKINDLEKHELSEVILEDVEKAFGISNKADVYIPIDDALLREALAELHELVGLEEVKRDVDEIAKLVRYYTEIGRNVKQAFSLHTVFTGNPGTGKTTVARIMVKIYKALGVLERGHLVETDRKGLVAGYVGQTALKTDEIIQSAMGGGLFIDEAYALSEAGAEHNFGREAIDTLLKRMEDFRGQFMVIVAGYPEEMKKFLEANPGLLSRFDRTLHFADYTEEQLFQITEDMLEQENLYADDQAKQLIRSYIQKLLAHKHRYFGNARTIRKFTKEVARRQNLRLAAMAADQRTHEMVKTVCIEDIEGIKLLEQEEGPKQSSIGFKA